jgi:hypothetical protein
MACGKKKSRGPNPHRKKNRVGQIRTAKKIAWAKSAKNRVGQIRTEVAFWPGVSARILQRDFF